MKTFVKLLVLGVLSLSTLSLAGEHRDRLNARIYGRIERWFPILAGQGDSGPQPQFSAFTASGAGTFGPCSSTPPTTSSGGTISVTRTTTANCLTQGLATTGLVPGDMVNLPINAARVMPNYQGVLGILVENLVTNLLKYSEQFDNAAWIKYQDFGAGLPVITPNVVLGLDNTMTADRMDLPATGMNQSSIIYQGVCTAGQDCSVGWFVRGVPGVSDSGTLDICAGNTGPQTCTPCTYVSGSWSYCKRLGVANVVSSVFIGNATFYNGGTNRPAQSVYIWGAHAFVNPYVAMYARTTTSGATTDSDTVQIDLGPTAPAPNLFSIAISSSGYDDTKAAPQYSAYLATNSTSFVETNPRGVWNYTNNNPTTTQRCIAGPDSGVFTLTGQVALTSSLALKRAACWVTTGNLMGSYNGLMMPPTALNVGTFSPARYLNIGNSGGVNVYTRAGLFTDFCMDADPTRCR